MNHQKEIYKVVIYITNNIITNYKKKLLNKSIFVDL